ncbi:hypothetical protein QR680_014577 [Steinernema hermaphroditum]|uniref:EF-hand domain-containing protein n=1 Tax=Steinernema hermaphroditum TaxID=289476 RepID=A0AA39IB07_9BILA|nr:hypothetical protein QR680_014577 [Steinernema hermaphroditum]
MMLLKVALFAFVLSTAHGSGSPKTVLAKIRTGVKWYTKIASRLDHIAPPDDVLINLASAVYELSSLDVSEAIDNELEQFGKVNDRIDEEINEGTNLLKSYLLQMELKHGLYEKVMSTDTRLANALKTLILANPHNPDRKSFQDLCSSAPSTAVRHLEKILAIEQQNGFKQFHDRYNYGFLEYEQFRALMTRIAF